MTEKNLKIATKYVPYKKIGKKTQQYVDVTGVILVVKTIIYIHHACQINLHYMSRMRGSG